MIHIILHFIVPLFVAIIFYKKDVKFSFIILVATMLVDIDHLIAEPIYSPDRCSIGFHPLHTWPFILLYLGLFLAPFIKYKKLKITPDNRSLYITHLVGLGLLIHMILDGTDCL